MHLNPSYQRSAIYVHDTGYKIWDNKCPTYLLNVDIQNSLISQHYIVLEFDTEFNIPIRRSRVIKSTSAFGLKGCFKT